MVNRNLVAALVIIIIVLGCNIPTIDKSIYLTHIKDSYKGLQIPTESDITEPVYFTNDFWDYFVQKYPVSMVSILYSPGLDTAKRLILKDSSFIVSTPDINIVYSIRNSLPLSADSSEKKGNLITPFLVDITEIDTTIQTGESEKIPKLTPQIKKEYLQFISLIRNAIPIFIFKREFQRKYESTLSGINITR